MNTQDILNSLPDKAAPVTPNDVLSSLPDRKPAAQTAFEQVSETDPNRVAKVQSLAARFAQPEPFIDAHLQEAEKAAGAPTDKFWMDLQALYPKTHTWLSSPQAMAIAHDDLDNLAHTENVVQAHGVISATLAGLEGSSAGLALRGKMPGIEVDENAPFAQKFAQQIGGLAGDLPAMTVGGLAAAIPGIATGPAEPFVASAGAFALPAAIKQALVEHYQNGDIQTTGELMRRIYSIGKETLKSGAIGLATAGGGKLGVSVLEGPITKGAGFVMKAGGNTAGELAAAKLGGELAGMTVGGAAVEGKAPTLEDLAMNTAVVGAMHGAGAIRSKFGLMRQEAMQTQMVKNAYLAMGDNAVASKLRARLPEAYQNFVAAVTKDGPIESVYVDREPAEVYFQSKGLDADATFEQMGATKEAINEAKETGGRVKISMADWTANVVGTEHYANLADDISFQPNAPTVRKTAEIQANMEKSFKALDEQIKTDEATKTDYEKAQTTFKADQMKLGVDEKQADAFAQVMAKRALYLAKAEGKTVDEVMGDRPTAATPEDYKYGFDKMGKPLVELTPEEIHQIDVENFHESVRDMGGLTPTLDAIRALGGIDWSKVKKAKMSLELADLEHLGIFRKGGKSVGEMAQALGEKGKFAQNLDEDKLAALIDKESKEANKFKAQYGEAKYQKLRKDKLYQAANAKTEKLLAGTKVVDAQGKPLMVFHGTDAVFGKFKEGGVNWFTTNSEDAADYNPASMKAVYVNLKNPADLDSSKVKKILAKAGIDALDLVDLTEKGELVKKVLSENGYDGLAVKRSDMDAVHYAAFSPDQIINAIGLKNPSALMQLDPVKFFQSAWHGSPHDFEKFSLHAIGTGEGAQAYGYGLYFAGDKAVAEYYRKNITGDNPRQGVHRFLNGKEVAQGTPEYMAGELLAHSLHNNRSLEDTKSDVQKRIDKPFNEKRQVPKLIKVLNVLNSIDTEKAFTEKRDEGKLYEVEIPDSDKMLDWDRPLGEQSAVVREAVAKSGITKEAEETKANYLASLSGEAKAIAEKMLAESKGKLTDGTHDADWKKLAELAPEVDHNVIHDIHTWYRMHDLQNGQGVYEALVNAKGGPEAASKFLHGLGIDGIRYADGNTRGKETVSHNYVIFDDNAVKILNKYYQAAQDNSENARGFYDVVNNLLVRGKNADASTYWHEFSHYYLDRLFKASKSGKANEEFNKDWATMSKWLGITADQTALTVEQHEQFARGSEAHLRGDDYTVEGKAGKFSVMSAMSGKSVRDFKTKKDADKWIKKNTVKAPSKELKAVFTRFRIWLTKVYPSIKALNVVLPDDVRQVFDRMAAGEDSITKAEIDLGLDKITDGLPEMDAAKLRAIHKEAHDEAVHQMTKYLLGGVKAKAKVDREALAQAVEKDAIKRLLGERKYKAKGMTDDATAQAYLDSKLSPKDGIKFSLNAELLGYSSGDEMAKEVLATRPMKEMVAAEVKRIMDAHDEMETPEKLEAKALELVHSEKRLEMMALERQLIHAHIFGKEITEGMRERWGQEASVEAAIAKRTAKDILSEKVGLEADKFTHFATMERNAAAKVAAALAIKDWTKAVVYKKHQMINHALYAQSLEISRLREKKMNRIDKIMSKPMELFKDQDSFDQVGMLLMRFGFGNLKRFAPTPKTLMLPEYIKKINSIFSDPLDPNVVSDGILNIPDWIASGPNKSWRSMTWAEFQDVTDAINNVIHAANKADSFFTINKKATLSAVADEMATAARDNNKEGSAPKVIDTKWDKAKHLINDYLYRLDGVDALTQKLDGYKDGGVWQNVFMDSMRSQADHEDRQMRQYRDEMKGAWADSFTEKEARDLFTKETYYEELGASMPKSTLISMYLNMGALENRDKLFANPIVGTKPDVWNEAFLTKFLGEHLTRKECEFGEKARDIINRLWPDIAQLNLDLTGFEPVKIEAVPYSLVLADGSVFQSKGGYYPLKSDARANTKFGEKTAQREMADSPLYTEQNSASRAMTKTGHTKKRTQANYTLQMDLGLMDRHLRDVIHDINFRGLVFDLRRLLANENVMMAVKGTVGPEAYNALLLHVNSYATGAQAEKLSSDPLSRAARWVGNRVSKVVIVGKIGVITQNVANMALAGNAVEGFSHWDAAKAILFRGIGGYWRPGAFYQAERNETLKFIWERSEFMRSKRMTPDYNLADIKEGNLTDTHHVREFFLGLMAGSDDLTNVPCWLEAYHKQIRAGKAEDEAIRHADLLVSRISGSGRKYDQALITKGSDMEKLFAKFYTFWNVEMANWKRNMGQVERDMVEKRMGAATSRFSGFVASRLLFIYASAMLTGGAPGDDEDKKKAWWWKQYMTYPLSFFPLVRDIASPMADQMVGMPSFGYRAAPVFDMPKTLGTTGADLVKFAKGDKELDAMLESASKSTAYAVGYPNQFNAWFWNAYDAMFNDMELRPQDIMVRRPKKDR